MQDQTHQVNQTTLVDLLLCDQFSNHCLANCVEPFRAANLLSGKQLYNWRYFTLDGETVRSSSGLPVKPDFKLGKDQRGEQLFVVSSYNHLQNDTPKMRQALQQATRRSKMIVGFDTGPWLMASAGILNGCKSTIHWDLLTDFKESFLDIEVLRERFVFDKNRGTCTGAMAAFDLTLEMISKMHGATLALEVANLFMKDRALDRGPEMLSHSPLVQAAMEVMQENLEHPVSINQIAKKIGCHEKALLRAFVSNLQAPPSKVYKRIRLSTVRDLLSESNVSITEIALRAGYSNPSAMGRAFKARFGLSPQKYRIDSRHQREINLS